MNAEYASLLPAATEKYNSQAPINIQTISVIVNGLDRKSPHRLTIWGLIAQHATLHSQYNAAATKPTLPYGGTTLSGAVGGLLFDIPDMPPLLQYIIMEYLEKYKSK